MLYGICVVCNVCVYPYISRETPCQTTGMCNKMYLEKLLDKILTSGLQQMSNDDKCKDNDGHSIVGTVM